MNNINFLVTNILIASAVFSIAILRWRRGRMGGNHWILAYPVSVKILAVVGLFFVYTGVSVLTELTPGVAAKIMVILLSIPAAVLVFMAAVDVFAAETSYNDTAVCRCSPWSRKILVDFNDVVRIENSPISYQFAIHSSDGKVIRVCKWTERAQEVLGYAQEGLEAYSEPSKAAAQAPVMGP